MGEAKSLTPQERMEKAAELLAFLEGQAIESVDDLADVVEMAVRAKLGRFQMGLFIQSLSLRTTQL